MCLAGNNAFMSYKSTIERVDDLENRLRAIEGYLKIDVFKESNYGFTVKKKKKSKK